MKYTNKTMNRLNRIPLILLSGLLLLSGCDDTPAPLAEVRMTDRPVATIYKVKAENTEAVQCYRIRDSGMIKITNLQSEQLVDIVAVEEGLIKLNDKLWLQIYPRLTHRPGCYVNVDNLIPYG